MSSESYQDRKGRVRPPRVHINYKVETEGGVVVKELPFVVGIMGDFSGNPTEPLPDLAERKFIDIDRDNIDDVMARFKPALNLRVENTLKGDGSEVDVQLAFNSMKDFEPGRVVAQVPSLRILLDARDKLQDLLVQAGRKPELEKMLERILQNTEEQKKMAAELGLENPRDGKPSAGGQP